MPVHIGIDFHRKRSQVTVDDAVARYSPTAARRIRRSGGKSQWADMPSGPHPNGLICAADIKIDP
jgi:hypothetical protein